MEFLTLLTGGDFIPHGYCYRWVSEEPDVIVLDLGLPDLDGYAFMKQLKECPATAHIPVIALTGRDPQGNHERSYDIGAFDFFQKPVIDNESS